MSDYFGKGCEYLSGQWEDERLYDDESYKENAPVLNCCRHPENKSDVEGSCTPDQCPFLCKNILLEGDSDGKLFEVNRQAFIEKLGSIKMQKMKDLFEEHINCRHKTQELASIMQNPIYITQNDLNNYLEKFNLFLINLRNLKVKTAKFVQDNMIKK